MWQNLDRLETSRAAAFCSPSPGHHRGLNGNREVMKGRCLPWKEEQLILVKVDFQAVCRHQGVEFFCDGKEGRLS